jgi:uncharacterized protein Smg (DUF494 family)
VFDSFVADIMDLRKDIESIDKELEAAGYNAQPIYH